MTATQAFVLVVDDNPDNRDMLSRRLARRGYTVAVAEDGDQALKMSDAEHFDLVLLDIIMPGISGLEVLKILRQRYSVSDLPVIMATAKDQSSDIVEALQLGANDYVTKPLDFPVVLARVQTQLALKQAMEEVRAANVEVQETRQYLTRLIESSTDAIISTNKDGIMELFNKGAETMLGYRAEDMIGQRVTLLYESEERAKEVMRQMRKRGGAVSAFETVLRAKDGTSIPVMISASILYDERGEETGTVGFNKDLRPLKETEEELRRAKAQIQALRIEIDQAKKVRQVSEITETDYFQELQSKAKALRDRSTTERA